MTIETIEDLKETEKESPGKTLFKIIAVKSHNVIKVNVITR